MAFYLISNPFTAPLKALLVWLSDLASGLPLPPYVSRYAVAIVVVAVLVKVATQPLMSQQQKMSRKMQQLQPRINELQKKHKDDREKLSQAQMELYREYGVNPFGGCLPLVVQMAVLFGLWRAITDLTVKQPDGSPGAMVGERFLWVPDLAGCEPNPTCHAELSLLPVAVPILVVLMVISQVLYQRVMTPPSRSNDPQQQAMNQMMKFMPLMFAYIFLKLPAGVVLYYVTFNIVGLVQQSLSNRLSPPEPLVAPSQAADAPSSTTEPRTADETAETIQEPSDEGATAGRRRRRRKGR